jgi:hypothetical protein
MGGGITSVGLVCAEYWDQMRKTQKILSRIYVTVDGILPYRTELS